MIWDLEEFVEQIDGVAIKFCFNFFDNRTCDV